MRNKLALLLAVPVILTGLVLVGGTAVATGGGDGCTPAQHYSWTGGPIAVDPPPAFPGGSWQANTSLEPHLQGGGDPATWVGEEGVGLHYTSHGSSGLADWFYYQPEVCPPPTTSSTTTAPPPPPPPTTECPALPETYTPTTECPPPPTTTEPPPPTTTEPPPPTTTEPPPPTTTEPPPPTTEPPPPPTTEVPPPTTEVPPPPPPPDTAPTCEEDPTQAGCETRLELARTGTDTGLKLGIGVVLILFGSGLMALSRRKLS